MEEVVVADVGAVVEAMRKKRIKSAISLKKFFLIGRMASKSEAPNPTDLSGGTASRKGKFHNGWTDEQEDLMAKWADIAACYRWLHDRCEKKYSGNNMSMTIPVIILSTLTGTASVGLNSIVGDDPMAQKYGQFAIGGVSLIAGILTTLGNFFKYAQLSESNRVAGIAWGKFQRQIAVELSLHPNDRLDSMDFIKICRAELDRLIEQSPPIPDKIIGDFLREFKDLPKLKRPDICRGIEHTEAYKDKNERLRNMAAEASIMIKHKKRMLREEIIPDIDNRLEKIMDAKIAELRNEIRAPVNARSMNSQVDTIVPKLMSRTISAYEPGWKKLILRSPGEQTAVVPPPVPAPAPAPPRGNKKKDDDAPTEFMTNPMHKDTVVEIKQ